jgi:hypothetical protein
MGYRWWFWSRSSVSCCGSALDGGRNRVVSEKAAEAVSAKRTALLVTLISLAALFWVGPRVLRWLAIDTCLDSGGRWDYSQNQCEK